MAAGYKPTLVKVNAHDNDKQKVKRVMTYCRDMESSFQEGQKKKKWNMLTSLIFMKCIVTEAVRNITTLTVEQRQTPTCVINAVEAHDYT